MPIGSEDLSNNAAESFARALTEGDTGTLADQASAFTRDSWFEKLLRAADNDEFRRNMIDEFDRFMDRLRTARRLNRLLGDDDRSDNE